MYYLQLLVQHVLLLREINSSATYMLVYVNTCISIMYPTTLQFWRNTMMLEGLLTEEKPMHHDFSNHNSNQNSREPEEHFEQTPCIGGIPCGNKGKVIPY